jgi:putative glutamine amidotransferase
MSTRIAIPEPTSTDFEYNGRSLPQYLAALQSAGAHAVIVPLHETPERVARLLAGTQGVLLPGSGFDVDPERYGEKPIPACGPADALRTAIDELLLQDAFNLHKPVLAICHGAQTLNVWRKGTLIQDLETVLHTAVDHRPGRDVVEAHPVAIAPSSHLETLQSATMGAPGPQTDLGKHDSQWIQSSVNSSHHQAIHQVGNNLRVAAISPADGVIEAVELDSPDHFVLGVQWHPERTYSVSPLSRALFTAFVHAAETWQSRPIGDPVTTS